MEIKRGQIYYADLGTGYGSEQGGLRPVLIVQNNIGNKYSPTTICVPLTTRMAKHKLPTHLLTSSSGTASLILCEQVKVIDKRRLGNFLCELSAEEMAKVNRCLAISVGI